MSELIWIGAGSAAAVAALAGWLGLRAAMLARRLALAEMRLADRDQALAALRRDNAELSQAADRITTLETALSTQSAASDQLLAAGRQALGLLDAAPFPIWRRDREARLVWVNRRYAEMAEVDAAQVIARGIELASSHGNTRPHDLALQAIAAGRSLNEERRFVADGDRRNFRIHEVPLPDGLLGYAQDITPEADARGQLKRHMEAHMEVLRTISTATAIYGPDKRLLLWNRAYARLWQLDETWLEQRPSYSEVLEQLRANRRLPEQIDWQAYRRAQLDLFTRVIERPEEELLHLPDGSTLRLTVSAYPSGGLFFAYDDVTRQLTLERATHTLIAVQRATLDNLYEAVMVHGPDGRLSLYNRAFAELWKLEPDWLNTQPHITEILEAARPLLRRGNDWTNLRARMMEDFAARRAGRGRIERDDDVVIDHASVPLPDGAALHTYLDVSDSIRIERALRDRNEALERTDRMNAAFIANITHELRSPLGTLISMTEVLAQGILGSMNERQSEYCRDIMQASRHLLRLLDDIIVIATIEVGQMALEPELFPLSAIWRDDVDGWNDLAERRGIQLDLPGSIDFGTGHGDPQRLRQALGAVMDAALGHTPQDGRVRLEARLEADDSLVLLVQSHTGGLAPIRPTRIFADLVNAPDRARSNANLSLVVARGLIELHGGQVSLERESTTEQCVRIQLPFSRNRSNAHLALPRQ